MQQEPAKPFMSQRETTQRGGRYGLPIVRAALQVWEEIERLDLVRNIAELEVLDYTVIPAEKAAPPGWGIASFVTRGSKGLGGSTARSGFAGYRIRDCVPATSATIRLYASRSPSF